MRHNNSLLHHYTSWLASLWYRGRLVWIGVVCFAPWCALLRCWRPVWTVGVPPVQTALLRRPQKILAREARETAVSLFPSVGAGRGVVPLRS